MAIRSRRLPIGLIHHSDRRLRTVIATSYARVLRRPIEPAQYACGDDRKLLRLHGIKGLHEPQVGIASTTPLLESFFGSLKTELVHRTRFLPGARPGLRYSSTSRSSITNDGAIRASATGRRHRPGGI